MGLGAQIFLPILAQKKSVEPEPQQFTLGTNFRSSTDIVSSVNSLFS